MTSLKNHHFKTPSLPMNGNKLSDKIPTKTIFKELNILSVNQINAQIKLLEIWKSFQSETYPMKWSRRNDLTQERRTRASESNQLNVEYGCSTLTSIFKNDAARVWNNAPDTVKSSTSLFSAKNTLKSTC